jgi:hypothetical protein
MARLIRFRRIHKKLVLPNRLGESRSQRDSHQKRRS